MIEWRDQGALLSVRKHGENAVIAEVFTAKHGRHAGVIRGGTSRKIAPILQAGAQLDVAWKARLEEHLGAFQVEPIRSRAASVMSDRLALAGLNAVCALLGFALPERDPHPELYHQSILMLDLLAYGNAWPLAYLRWEMFLLEDLGYGLDLSQCAVTGAVDGLRYVSPKSGRAVSLSGAGEWADRLLPLPPVMLGDGDADNTEIIAALATTGHFLENHLAKALGDRSIPAARDRLITALARHSTA